MLTPFIKQLQQGQSLTQAQSYEAVQMMLSPHTPTEQIIDYLTLLHQKGETSAEILGVITALQEKMLQAPVSSRVLDIVGTGGDNSGSVNISTGAAILAASCGVPMVKLGNRAVSSLAGAADVLEALQINFAMDPKQLIECLEATNIAFCFAQKYHPAFAQLREIRRQIKGATIFNLVGPFLNPANPQHIVLGVGSKPLMQSFADILTALSLRKSVIVHSDGMDEMSCSGTVYVIEVDQGQQRYYEIDPADFVKPYPRELLKGGDAKLNAELLVQTFQGKSGAIAETLILNAAMAVYIYGIVNTLREAVFLAREQLAAGAAMQQLKQWQEFSRGTTAFQ